MTSDDEVLSGLRLAIERVGVTNLARRPGLARNVLGDLLPGDPLSVSLLSAAAEQGAVERLQDQADEDLGIVAPRLAEGLATSRGLVPAQARWAIDTWATALGRQLPTQPLAPGDIPGPPARGAAVDAAGETRSPAAPEPETRVAGVPEPETRVAGAAEPETRRAAEAGATPNVAPAPAARPQPTIPEPAKQPKPPRAARVRPPVSSTTPETTGERRRRPVLLVAGAAVVVLAAVGVVLMLVLKPGSAEASTWSRTAFVQPKTAGVVATVSHDMSQPVGAKRIQLHNGDQIEVKTGPVEVRLGDSVLRLDDGTTLSYTAGTKSTVPLLTMAEGQVWVNVAKGQHLALRSPSAEHADLTSGRFVAKCDNACTYETLDEPQLVHTGGSAYTMKPHQRFLPSTKSTESMDSQMDMTPASAEPSGGMDGMGGMSEPDPNAPKPEFVAPDVLRSTPWIAENVKIDRKQARAYDAIGGRSLLGAWTVMLERPDVPADVHRVVTFSLSHCDVATCAFGASSTYVDAAGAQKTIRAYVETQDAKGDVVRLTWDPVSVACRTFGKADGTQDVVDNLTFSGKAGGSGTRVAKYTPDDGSPCTSQGDRESAAATIAIVAHADITKDEAPFTSPGPTESLVLNHVRGTTSSCSANKQRLDGETADATCTPSSAQSGGPSTIAYYAFPSDAALTKAYDAQVAKSKQKRDDGDCNQGLCERETSGGRRLIYGDAFLVETSYRDKMMIVASGSVRSQLARWRQSTEDFSFAPFPVRGY